MRPQTITEAEQYWDRYYGQKFIFGLGTEHIIAMLQRIPPAQTWIDLGAGSESLLWSIPLHAGRLIAVDQDPDRLALLRRYAAARLPRPAYETVLQLSGRTSADFAARCDRLIATVTADCLTGRPLPLAHSRAGLVTQFGLLGLTTTLQQFLTCWQHAHDLLAPGGWCAGANWNATNPGDRITLTRQAYATALAASGITPVLIKCVPITADADFHSVWIYLGRKT